MAMQFLHASAVPVVVLRELPVHAGQPATEGMPVLAAVRARGRLRVGYSDSQPPYNYFNARGDLVGFDVEMAHALAGELGVGLEFVPVPRERLSEVMAAGLCDVAMCGIAVTTERAEQMDFSPPYLDETLAFVVRDERRTEFSSAESIRKSSGLRIAVPNLPYYLQLAKREFPSASIVPVTNPEDFLTGREGSADALALPAERGSFMTLLHPDFSVAVPHPLAIRIPLAYPVARHDLGMVRFLATWIDLKRKDGTIQALYDHWILGREARAPKPHWSVLRNVLHWVD
jgi:ABC-type amino acid transport substrate-binding protein